MGGLFVDITDVIVAVIFGGWMQKMEDNDNKDNVFTITNSLGTFTVLAKCTNVL